MRFLISLLLSLALVLQAHASPLAGQWIDLTHEFSSDTIYWPTAEEFKHTPVAKGYTDKGYYYSAYNYCAAEHGGTHVDAPVHFGEGKHSIEQIPLRQLIGPGALIRVSVSEKNLNNRNYQITVDDLRKWEKRNGPLPEKAIVLFDTGSARFWPDKALYMGTAERGEQAIPKLSFPGISPGLAKFMLKNRNIRAVGLDSPSLDFGASTTFETHQILAAANIPGFENVANLSQLPETGFWVLAFPMKIKGGSGAPARIVAFIPALPDITFGPKADSE